MKHFELVDSGIDVAPLLAELELHPELWDQNTNRTRADVFKGTSDIWVRARARGELVTTENFREPHEQSWYPAWSDLTALHPIVFGLMATIKATSLGSILITRIPPGGRILPHNDKGSWHAEHFDRKIYVPLKTNDFCINYCGDEAVTMGVGEAWFFDNLTTHWVKNDGPTERITVIVCMRNR